MAMGQTALPSASLRGELLGRHRDRLLPESEQSGPRKELSRVRNAVTLAAHFVYTDDRAWVRICANKDGTCLQYNVILVQ